MLLAGGAGLWWGLSGGRGISLKVDREPVERVVGLVRKQTAEEIVVSGRSPALLTFAVERAVLADVMDLVAEQSDGDARRVVVLSRNAGGLRAAREGFVSGAAPEGWRRAGGMTRGFGGGGGGPGGTESLIVRNRDGEALITLKLGGAPLEDALRQVAFRAGVDFWIEPGLEAAVSLDLRKQPLGEAVARVAKQAGAVADSFFVLRYRAEGERGPGVGEGMPFAFRGWRESGPSGGEGREREGDGPSPEEMERRRAQMEAWVALLPEDERKRMEEMRAFWESLRDLPREERMRKMEERMSQPDMQERMSQRDQRNLKNRTPEQRHDRWQRMNRRESGGGRG